MCEHLNVVITEYGTSHYSHDYEDGRPVHHYHGYGDLTGMCEARCKDCPMVKRFNRLHVEKLPAWLRTRLDSIGEI